MQIYHYHQETKELLGSSFASESPLEPGTFLIPAHATSTKPPTPTVGMVVCFINGLWESVENNRGTVWEKATASPVAFRELGPLPDHLTNIEPIGLCPKWDGSKWVMDITAAQEVIKDAIKGKEASKSDRKIEHPQIPGAFFKPSPKIDKILMRSDALANTDPLPINGGCFDDIDENPIPMTVGQLKKLRNAIIDREEANYRVRKQHIKNMKLAVDPLTYDYSTGWN